MKNITLGQFIRIRSLNKTGDEIKDTIKILSIIYGKPESYFNNLRYGKLNKYTKPLTGLDLNKIQENKRKGFLYKAMFYNRKDYQDLTNEEMININSVLDSEMNEGVKIMKVLEILYKPFYKSKFKVNDKFKDMDLIKAYSHILFFFDGGRRYYLKRFQDCLDQMKKMKIKEITKETQSHLQNVQLLVQYLKSGNGMSLSQYLEKEKQLDGLKQVN